MDAAKRMSEDSLRAIHFNHAHSRTCMTLLRSMRYDDPKAHDIAEHSLLNGKSAFSIK